MRRRGSNTVGRPASRIAKFGVLAAALLVAFAESVEAGNASSSTPTAAPPVNRRPPRVSGTAQVGRILLADRGSWRRDRASVFSYQWRLCDPAGTTCADIEGATDRIYPVRPANAGQRVLVAVTAATSGGKATASSAATPLVRDAATGSPLATERPTITGKTQIGSVLTADGGTWQGDEPIRLTYRWRRCTSAGGACEDLERTTQTYLVSARDAGHTLRVLVRTENAIATSAALSDPTAAVPGSATPGGAPRNRSAPQISGIAAQGQALTATSGSWSGATPMSFALQWRRCSRHGDDCSSIPRATRQTYVLVAADVGRTIRVRLTARNPAGSASATSGRTRVVVGAAAPVNTSSPRITGIARDGSVLTVAPGDWKGTEPISFRYRWLRCGAGAGNCAAVPGADGKSRTLTSADIGRTLRARVTATNAAGSSTVLSTPSPVIAGTGTAPANRAAPALSGAAQQGSRLTLSTGTWTGTQPISFSYTWLRCDASVGHCRELDGATGSSYVLVRADVGHRLYGTVTARNDAGSSSASSNATPVVIGAPVNRSQPTISGAAVEGQTLTANPGTWVGVGRVTFGYQWTRCNAAGEFSSCAPIVVTSRPSYTLGAADVGLRVFVQVKALNRYGASFVNSPLTSVISEAPIGTVTVRATRSQVVYGGRVALTGRVVGARPGEPVAIVEQRAGVGRRIIRNAAVTSTAGTWTYVARPAVRTTYQVRVRGRTSASVTVFVKPHLRLRKVGPGRLSLRVQAARSLGGRTAFLQRWNAKKHRWVSVQRVRLRAIGDRAAPTVVSSAAFRTRAPRGTVLRIVLTGRQAGAGYLTGISNRVRA